MAHANVNQTTDRMVTVKLLLILAMIRGWTVKALDVKQAFANTPVPSNVHTCCSYPPGYGRKGYALRRKRYGYGLHESPTEFNKLFLNWITKQKYTGMKQSKQSKIDGCLFYNGDMWVGLYVDDVLCTGQQDKIDEFLTCMKSLT